MIRKGVGCCKVEEEKTDIQAGSEIQRAQQVLTGSG